MPLTQDRADFVQNGRIIDGCWHLPFLSVRHLLDGGAQDFAGAGLRQTLDGKRQPEGGDRADGVANHADTFLLDLLRIAVDIGFQHQKAAGNLPLQGIGNAKHGAFGHIGMAGENLLHRAC